MTRQPIKVSADAFPSLDVDRQREIWRLWWRPSSWPRQPIGARAGRRTGWK